MSGGSVAAEPVGTLDVALAHAQRLLQRDPKAGEKLVGDYRALAQVEIPADVPAETAKSLKAYLARCQIQSLMVIG